MAHQHQVGSEAFRWLDANMIAAAEAPDEAFDYVFMLCQDDWNLLEQVWRERSAAWRVACAYLIEGPVKSSQRLLRLGLEDPNDEVAAQAATSICAQVLDHPDKIAFDPALAPRLRELRAHHADCDLKEVDEILKRYGGA